MNESLINLINSYSTQDLITEFYNVIPIAIVVIIPIASVSALIFFAIKVTRKILNV